MKQELQYLYALIFIALIGSITPARAQTGNPTMDAHWTIKTNDGSHFIVELGIKTNTDHEHLGPAQFIFLYNHNFMTFNGNSTGTGASGTDYNWLDSFNPAIYPDNLTGYASTSGVSQPSLGTIVINLDFNGAPGAAISSSSDFTPVIDIAFTIVDPSKSDSITWQMNESSPPTFDAVEDDVYGNIDEGTFNRLDIAALPVTLIHFNAEIKNNIAYITWATASEINNNYFTIERSSDGQHFRSVKQVKGAGNSESIKEYSEIDPDPLPGTSYYRLKQTDYNSDTQVYYMVTVQNAPGTNAEIQNVNVSTLGQYPEISYSMSIATDLKLRVTDMNGKLVLDQSVPSLPGTNKIELKDIPALKPGMYFISLYSGDDVVNAKMIMP